MLPSTNFVLLAIFTVVVQSTTTPEAFPVVNLGYAQHAPTKINVTTTNNISYATYSNIRFAQAPLNELRFRTPQTPPPFQQGVQDGIAPVNSTNCIQSIPYNFFVGVLNGTSWGNEDCLFLDVIVPEGIEAGDNVPVLHWLYGGGFFFGGKDNGGNPAALFDDMTENEKFVIVASNYRLGPLGFMSSDEEPSLAVNAGLYDALAGLEWTQENIHRFGGDRNKVTAMGQSAGAGIVEHLLAAASEGVSTPFYQAILSSPAYRPHYNRSMEMTYLYDLFLNLTNCSDPVCLRSIPSDPIKEADRYIFQDAPTNGFPGPSISYGPVIDQNLVHDIPMRTLNAGSVNSTPAYVQRILGGGMMNEGAASTIGEYHSWLEQLSIFARTPTQSSADILASLYGDSNGSYQSFLPDGSIMETPFDKFCGDIIFRCHVSIAANAYSQLGPQNQYWQNLSLPNTTSYRYELSILPAVHGDDLYYYFYNEVIAAAMPTVNTDVARKFQHYVRIFILGQDMEDWPEYSSTGLATPAWMNITDQGFQVANGGVEADRVERCPAIVGLFSNPDDGW